MTGNSDNSSKNNILGIRKSVLQMFLDSIMKDSELNNTKEFSDFLSKSDSVKKQKYFRNKNSKNILNINLKKILLWRFFFFKI